MKRSNVLCDRDTWMDADEAKEFRADRWDHLLFQEIQKKG